MYFLYWFCVAVSEVTCMSIHKTTNERLAEKVAYRVISSTEGCL